MSGNSTDAADPGDAALPKSLIEEKTNNKKTPPELTVKSSAQKNTAGEVGGKGAVHLKL